MEISLNLNTNALSMNKFYPETVSISYGDKSKFELDVSDEQLDQMVKVSISYGDKSKFEPATLQWQKFKELFQSPMEISLNLNENS
ncbi:hypothetical protein CRC_00516 [Cylindrospermopsis raciborskii CS-505]|nr:hypothetical protein CRC_00516 [Cylindrospermopsis raciborskii CS-505]